jgi:hypothetical protein
MRCPLKWVGLAMALLGILVAGSVNYAQLDRNKGVEAARFTIDGKETVRLKIYATLAEGKQIRVTIGQNEITFTWTAENAKDGLDTGYLEISGSEVLVQLLDVGAPNRCQIPVREIPKVEKWEDRRPFCQARPAYFTVTDLFISPSSPQVNQSVTIRAIIRNTGEEAGTKTVTLYIDGSLKDSRSLTLNAGQSDTVSFSYTFSYSGTYTVKVSTPDDYRSTTVSVQARPAYFQVSSCSIPSSAKVNESASFSARITNTGGSSGSQYIRLLIDGRRVDSKYVSLGAGESTTVYFSYTFSYSGSYSVRIESDNDYCSGSITIRTVNQPPRITNVRAASSTSGDRVSIGISIDFTDPDGNVALLIFQCEALSSNTYCDYPYVNQTFEIDISSEAAGITSGTIVWSGKCKVAHTSWRFTFILVDQGGLRSNSWTINTGGYAGCETSISVHRR